MLGKASILAVRGDFNQALLLLPDTLPVTRNDWVAWHIRGMILLRQNELDRAIGFFEEGRHQTPFVRERRFFEGALSVARMRKGQFEQAVQSLGESPGGSRALLSFTLMLATGIFRLARVSYDELSLKCPSQLVDLREAIAARYRIISKLGHHSDNWVFERETEALLPAKTRLQIMRPRA